MNTRNYKTGSIVYVEGDKALDILLIRSGAVLLTYIDTMKKDKEEVVKKGQFFGILSVLGSHMREETARVIQDCEVVVLSEPEFQKVASKNTAVMIQMLQSFSSILRREHRALQKILGENEDNNNLGDKLFQMGLYFYETKQIEYAKYAFNSYLQNFKGVQEIKITKQVETALKYISSNFLFDNFQHEILEKDKI